MAAENVRAPGIIILQFVSEAAGDDWAGALGLHTMK